MSEWKEYQLRDWLVFNYGKGLRESDRKDGNIPVYSSAGLTGWHDKPLENGKGIIVGRKGSVGTVYYSDVPFFCIDTAYYITEEEDYDLKFFYYFLKYMRLDRLNEDSAVPGLNRDNAYSQFIRIPQKDEQIVIRKYLSSLDDKIELLRRQNETLEAMASALFARWFVDFEFPNENGKPYKSSGGAMTDSDLGEIPEGWKVKSMSDVADFLNGLAMQKFRAKQDEPSFPVIKIKEMKNGITSETDRANLKVPDEYIIDFGDVVFSWSGSLEVMLWNHGKGALNQHLFKVTSGDYPKWFYLFWIKRHLPFFKMIAESKATTMGHIKKSHLKERKCLIPTNSQLQAMNSVFSPLLKKTTVNEIEIDTLTRLRNLLLPKLMSGEIRVEGD